MIGPTVIASLAEAIALAYVDEPARVAIDGRSAAGKSHFARSLADALRARGRAVVQVSIDDFHTPGHKQRSAAEEYTAESYLDTAFDYQRFRAWVLDPLMPGGDRTVRRRYWVAYEDRPARADPVVVDRAAVVIAEGAFLLRPEFADCWDLTIWLHVDFETMIERALARDVAWVGDATKVRRRYINRYIPVHELYESRYQPVQNAHVVIDNGDPPDPVVVRQPEHWRLG